MGIAARSILVFRNILIQKAAACTISFITGSARLAGLWTRLNHVFGVRGFRGDLLLAPQLVKEEFNKKALYFVSCQICRPYALTVEYHNPKI